jgi:hypothetical protein
MGFADQVAGGMRARSRNADAWIEAKVGRALGRRPPAAPPPDGGINLDGDHSQESP